MDNHSLIVQLREVFRSPEPEEKEMFLLRVKERYPENRRPAGLAPIPGSLRNVWRFSRLLHRRNKTHYIG